MRVIFSDEPDEVLPAGARPEPVIHNEGEPVFPTSILKGGSFRAPEGAETVDSLAPVELGDQNTSVKERRAIEARTLRHLVLHEKKNSECDACQRGNIQKGSIAVTKGRSFDPDVEKQAQQPTAYGQLLSADIVVASPN